MAAASIKQCTKCGKEQSADCFYLDGRDGHSSGICKTCRIAQTTAYRIKNPDKSRQWSLNYKRKNPEKAKARELAYKKKFPEKVREAARKNVRKRFLRSLNIDEDIISATFKAQGGICAICKIEGRSGARHGGLVVDHCHVTNKFRGLLCSPCNTALGKFQDSPAIVHRAADYLLQFRGGIIKV